MHWNKKIPAFTLIEMLVAMAISVIVVGIAYTVLNLVYRNIGRIQTNYYASTELDLFSQQLNVDFNNFGSINYSLFDRELKFRNPTDSILYDFNDNYILRNKDTIWQGSYVKEVYLLGKQTNSGMIDAIKMTFPVGDRENSIFHSKELDATTRMILDGN